MFTGIVEQLGRVSEIQKTEDGATLVIEGPLVAGDLGVGDSVAVNGTCLTAVDIDSSAGAFTVELVLETLNRTSFADLATGSRVNLERAMPAGGRFDGHVVQGHVDGVGRVASVEPEGDGRRIGVGVPEKLMRYVVEKGSITLDGVSLTVAGVLAQGIEVALIPHTLEVTTLGSRTVGDLINIEVDILAKYVERLMEMHR